MANPAAMQLRLAVCLMLLGAMPCAVAQCGIDLPDDQVDLYLGYDPLACTTLVPVVNGAQPYDLVWNNGLTTPSIEVCATVSQWVFVALQDDTSCYATDSVYINVVDVRCGDDLDKVLICHTPPGNPANAHTLCIAPSAVPAHFAHGCELGDCTFALGIPTPEAAPGYTLVVSLAPNPISTTGTVRVVSLRNQHVRVRALDPMGRVVAQLLDTDMVANQDVQIQLDERHFPTDLNAVWIESVGDSERRVQPLILSR